MSLSSTAKSRKPAAQRAGGGSTPHFLTLVPIHFKTLRLRGKKFSHRYDASEKVKRAKAAAQIHRQGQHFSTSTKNNKACPALISGKLLHL